MKLDERRLYKLHRTINAEERSNTIYNLGTRKLKTSAFGIKSMNSKSCTNFFVDVHDENELINRSIKKISKKIEVITTGEYRKNNCGSLYELFQSDYFDMNLLVCYLDKKDEVGVVDTLVNIMFRRYINESFFYIPQICTMITYKPYSEAIENYILDRCVDQMKFSLKTHWLISSYVENAEPKIIKKYDRLIQCIEMTLVNGRRSTMSNFKLYHSLHIKSEEEVYKQSLDKECRLNYFDKVMRFYHDLKGMCQKLKDVPKENRADPKRTRNHVMRKYLKGFNKNIETLRSSNVLSEDTDTITKSFFNGYILPFDDSSSTNDEYNSLIVNFLPEYSFCFSTKARVPVKVTVETIRVLECKYWDEMIIEKPVNSEEDRPVFSSRSSFNSVNTYQNVCEIVEYTSIDDFFKRIDIVEKSEAEEQPEIKTEYLATEENPEKKEKEAKKIVESIMKANSKFLKVSVYRKIENWRRI